MSFRAAWTPYFFFDSFFTKGLQATKDLAAIGIAKVEKRKLASRDSSRRDILYYLLSAKDPDTGGDLPDLEIKAEALTQLIAGSDTTGNTITHMVDMLCRNPAALKTLQQELDVTYPDPIEPGFVAMFEDCKDLPFTEGVINETLRLRTTVSVGLPRVVPKGGAMVCGRFFEAGTVLSTPTYTTHRDTRVWGPDALEFKPERWTRPGSGELEKAFLGFSYGPRACIGRNVSFLSFSFCFSLKFRVRAHEGMSSASLRGGVRLANNLARPGCLYGTQKDGGHVVPAFRVQAHLPGKGLAYSRRFPFEVSRIAGLCEEEDSMSAATMRKSGTWSKNYDPRNEGDDPEIDEDTPYTPSIMNKNGNVSALVSRLSNATLACDMGTAVYVKVTRKFEVTVPLPVQGFVRYLACDMGTPV
jgi:hypothetical protein